MEVIRGLHNLRGRHRGAVVTIGNFDGVHLGHQAILRKVRARADSLQRPAMLICFEPQPQEFFKAFQAPARLTRFREKVELLAGQGIDQVLCLKFNDATRHMPAPAFVRLLTGRLAVSALYAGDDFRFGKDQEGGFADLQAAGKAGGFAVTNLYTLAQGGARISSTRIRACLAAGDLQGAGELLGRPYAISGKVVYGRQLGRTLDVPTANIQLHRYVAPLAGVFAVEVALPKAQPAAPGTAQGAAQEVGQGAAQEVGQGAAQEVGQGAEQEVGQGAAQGMTQEAEQGRAQGAAPGAVALYPGVANVGVRPTVEAEGVKPLLEVHLFDFGGNLYGQRAQVIFRRKLREEKKFASIEALKQAIAQDLANAKAFFASQ